MDWSKHAILARWTQFRKTRNRAKKRLNWVMVDVVILNLRFVVRGLNYLWSMEKERTR